MCRETIGRRQIIIYKTDDLIFLRKAKTMKRFITLFLTICILLSSVLTINAMEIMHTEMETGSNEDGKENELMPLAADDECDEDGDGIPDDEEDDGTMGGLPSINVNTLHHIFDKPEHNLSDFLASYNGNQTKAFNAVYSVAQTYVTNNGITGVINKTNEITVNVNNYPITFRGYVSDGILSIATFFIK